MRKKTIYILAALCGIFLPPAGLMAQSEVIDKRVDQSIDRGLEFLASVQKPDGSFPYKYGDTSAIPALAGMAFLAKGYTPGNDRFGACINRSIDYILNTADPNSGYFGKVGNGRMYAHSICTLFLCEVSGMCDPARQERIDAIMPKAVKVLLDAQNVRKNENNAGGWRYTPTSNDSDMSCSGWALMALRSSKLNGGVIPSSAIERAVSYVKRHHDQGQGSFGYQNGTQNAVTLTGAGILCLELCGKHNDPASLRAARYLMRIYRELLNDGNRFYGTYYTAQGLFQIGGDYWKTFSDWMYRTWIDRQSIDGSWRGNGEEESPCYATSLMVLAFAVPYRQLPIYQRDETVDEE